MDEERLRQLFDLSDRVVVVTGGTRDIGLALAKVVVASSTVQSRGPRTS